MVLSISSILATLTKAVGARSDYMSDEVPPNITVLSPTDGTCYHDGDVALNFIVSEPTAWIGYSLDGEDNVTIAGNITLTDLSYGPHTITVYANDTAGCMGCSETVYFTVTFLTDLNYDGIVDITDVSVAARAFGSCLGHSRWNPDADINKDGVVDIADPSSIAEDFGKTWE